MAEVTRQVQPMQGLLKKLHEWQLCFYSNGTPDIPKGFFQRRVEKDDERAANMLGEITKLNDHKAAVDAFILELRLAREFREKREQEAKDRRKFWLLKIVLPVVIGILSIVGVVIKQSAPVVKILIDDYLQAHPHVSQQLKNKAATDVDPVYASGQDSGLPTQYQPR